MKKKNRIIIWLYKNAYLFIPLFFLFIARIFIYSWIVKQNLLYKYGYKYRHGKGVKGRFKAKVHKIDKKKGKCEKKKLCVQKSI